MLPAKFITYSVMSMCLQVRENGCPTSYATQTSPYLPMYIVRFCFHDLQLSIWGLLSVNHPILPFHKDLHTTINYMQAKTNYSELQKTFNIQLNVTSSTTIFIYLYSIGLRVSTYNVVIITATLEQVIGLLCTYWDPNATAQPCRRTRFSRQ
jgi:hypothetical protein